MMHLTCEQVQGTGDGRKQVGDMGGKEADGEAAGGAPEQLLYEALDL